MNRSHPLFLAALVLATPALAQDTGSSCTPLTLTAVAWDDDALVLPIPHGSVSSRIDGEPRSVRDGDFLITAPSRGSSFAGSDEAIVWVFNLRENGTTWNAFRALSAPVLSSATLDLAFSPRTTAANNDVVALLGLTQPNPPIRPWHETGEPGPIDLTRTYEISVDLLHHYDAAELTDLLTSTFEARVTAQYADDALVEYARLTLVFDTCGS